MQIERILTENSFVVRNQGLFCTINKTIKITHNQPRMLWKDV